MTREMKDSGIEWIGTIPINWDLYKISQLYEQRTEKVSSLDYIPLSVTKNGIVPQIETAAKSKSPNDRKLVLKNDFVINSRSDRKMSSGISLYEGSVSLINTILFSEQVNPKFSNHLLKNYGFAEEFYRWGTGIVDDLWSTNFSRMKDIIVPLPSKDEQNKIANFLDSETSEIDQLITNTEKSIEELKAYKQSLITEVVTKGLDSNVEMKDSGVEWIGDIPASWQTARIKNLFSLKGRIGWQGLTTKDHTDEGPHLITGTDFNNGVINWNTTVHINENRFEEAPEIHIKENDLLITKDGTIGKVAFAKNAPEKASLNSGVMLIRELDNVKQKISKRYMYYVLLSNVFWSWYNMSDQGGSTIKHLYQGQFYNFNFPVPTFEEQRSIYKYLDDKTNTINTSINLKQKMIKELKNYKQSLIYEYVTGKKEVK